MPSRLLQHVLYQLFALAAQAGCMLLLYLSGFGQSPFPELPVPTIVFFGLLLQGPLYSVSRNFGLWELAGAAALALVLGAGFGWLVPEASGYAASYMLALASAVGVSLLLRLLRGQVWTREGRPGTHGDMLSAMLVYIACTVLATYTLDSFIPLGGFFLVNVGTFFFGVTFTQRDRVHRFGRRNVYVMIFLAAVANVVMSLTLDTPIRYVIVSFLAILISESADTEVYHRLLHRPWLVRVASSNAVSTPLDSIIFTVLAFAGEAWATFQWMVQVIVTDVLVKYAASMIVALGVLNWFRPDLAPKGPETVVPPPARPG